MRFSVKACLERSLMFAVTAVAAVIAAVYIVRSGTQGYEP